MTITEFLLARIAEDEAAVLNGWDSDGTARVATMWTGPEPGYTTVASDQGDGVWTADGREVEDARHVRILFDPARVLAECAAKRRIVELHRGWPVLVETQPTFEPADPADVNAMTYRMSKQIMWQTEQEYRSRFGDEPPTSAIMRALAAVYADHPDYDPAWA